MTIWIDEKAQQAWRILANGHEIRIHINGARLLLRTGKAVTA